MRRAGRVGGDVGQPSDLDEALHLGAAVGGDEEQLGVLDRRTQQADLAGVRVGGMLVEVVAVGIVGADDEAEIAQRREGRGAGADGQAGVAEEAAQPGLPPLFG